MRTIMLSALGAIGVTGIGYGFMPGGEVYPLPAAEVEAKLRAMDIPIELGLDNGDASVAVEGEAGSSVRWQLSQRGESVGWIEAQLASVDAEHTRVTVDFKLSESGRNAEQAAILNKQTFVKRIGVMAIGEAVDAALEDRAYDRSAVGRHAMTYAALHPEEIRGFKDVLDEVEYAARRARAESRDESRYDAELNARRPEIAVQQRQYEAERAMRKASEPMVDPTREARGYDPY